MAKGLHYIATLDNSDLKKKLADQRRMIVDSGKLAEEQASKVDSSVKRAAQGLAMLGGGISVAYLAKELYAFSNAFDKSMKEVSTISATVSADMAGFKNSVLELTTQVPVGADEAAKALYQIVSAGHDGANGMQVLEVAAKAAIGGVTETVTAADAITTVLNAYKKDASEAENISDQLFTTVRLGKTTFGELGQTISQAVPIAASFGIETEQVLAAVATLTKSGTPTAQAMTQIRASIVAASKVLGDGYFATHTFQEGLAEIANRAGGSESELRKLVPEIEAINGVLGLTGINAETAAADLAELGMSAGATQQAFVKMNAHADAQLTILKNTILKKFQDVGQGAVDMVGSFAELLTSDGVFNDKVIDDVIASLVVLIATVGTYQASLIATNAIQRVSTSVQYAVEMEDLIKLLPMKQADANADIISAVAKGRLSQATAERLIAIRAEVQAELEVLKVKAQVLAAEAVEAEKIHLKAVRRSVTAKESMDLAKSQMKIALEGGDADEIAAAKVAAKTAKTEMNSAAIASNTTRQALKTAQTKSSAAATAVDTMQTNINTAATNGSTTAKNLFTAATSRLTKAFHSLKLSFASNPFGLLLTAVSLVISAITMFASKTKDAKQALEGTKVAIDNIVKEFKEFDKKADNIKRLSDEYEILKSKTELTKDETQRLTNILNILSRAYPDAVTKVNEYGDAIDINTGKINRAIEAERKLLLIKNKDTIDKTAETAGAAYKDYVESAERVSNARAKENQWKEKLESPAAQKFYTDKKYYKKGLSGAESSTLVYKAEADKKLDMVYAYIKEMEKLSMTSAEIAQRINEEIGTKLTEGNINWIKKTVEGVAEVNNELGKVSDAGKVGNSIYGTDYKAAKKEWEDAKKELEKIEQNKDAYTRKQYDDAKKRATDAEASFKDLETKLPKQGKTSPKDHTAQLAKDAQEKARLKVDLENEVRQAEINAMDNGLKKVLAQNELNHKKEIEQIERQKEEKLLKNQTWERNEWESKNPNFEKEGKKFVPQTTISAEDNDKFVKMETSATEVFNSNNKKAYEDSIKDYANFAQTYIDKANEFENNLKTLGENHKQERANLLNSGASKEAIDQFDKKAKDEVKIITEFQQGLLAGLDEQMGIKSQSFILFAEQMANMGIEQLKTKLDEAEQLLTEAQAAGTTGDESSVAEYKAQIVALKQQLLALTKKDNKDANKDAKKEDTAHEKTMAKHKATQQAVNEIGGAAKEIAEAFKGLNGNIFDVMDSIGSMSSSVGKMLGSIVSMDAVSKATIAGTSTAANTAVLGTATAASTGIQAVEKASVILAIIGAALQIATAIAKAVAEAFNDDKKKEAEIKRLQGEVDRLSDSYDTLGEAIDKAYSTDASQMIEQQNQLLEQQKEAIRLQIAQEDAKKDTDQGKIDDWNRQLAEIDKKTAENKEKAVDAIFGSDVKSAIEDFASAIADSWSGGSKSGADTAKDITKKMIKDVITTLLKSNIKDAVGALREKIEGFMKEDGFLSESEIAAIEADAAAIVERNRRTGEQYEKIFKNDDLTESTLAGQIRGTLATTESVAELGGILRGQYEAMNRTANGVEGLGFGIAETARTNALIAFNTERTADNTQLMASQLTEMKKDLVEIKNNTNKTYGAV